MKTNFSVVPRLLKKDPILAKRLSKAFLAQRKAMAIDRVFHPSTTDELGLIYFRLTPLCNLRCVMCGQRGDKGVLKGSFAANEAEKIVPLEDYKRLVDQIKDKRPVVYLWGGEPFMYPDLFPLIDYMMEAGLVVSVNTNGTYLEKFAKEIVERKWHALFVSLDGFEETNDRIRGAGSYKRVVAGFEAINREKERQGSHYPYMGVVTTVNNLNYKDLYSLAEATRPFKLAWHIYNLGTYTNDAIVDEQRAFMKRELDTDITCLQGYATGYNDDIDGKELYDILSRIHDMDIDHPIITVPALAPDKIDVYYSKLDEPVRTHCIVPWCQANIDYNGDVHFCADYNDYPLGNIREKPFFEIFNGERAQKFRLALKRSKNGLFPGCVRCYQNMLCGKRVNGF
ncbi:MAG: radical SAM protein [Spirochaetae bacterium HGW-Spirochaetae-3]|jgi:radical SAM protein with 4Fe4S-binding SPASM domain|nr:MAG: radical SAM protein [Spirochaetae bacterium HGW-Spirochaetae-3]